MAITANGNTTDIFKNLYEPGSDGVKNETLPKKTDKETTIPSDERFTGKVLRANNKIYLLTLGGGRFALDLQSTIDLSDYENKTITVFGKQVEGTIVNARITNTAVQKLTRKKISIDPEITKLADVVKRFLNRYEGRIKNLLTARPGYKYEDGHITKRLAIVAVVDQKINLSSVPDNSRLPDNFENYDVEVVTASPKNLLRFRYKKEYASLRNISDQLEPTLLESMVISEKESEELERGEITINYEPPSDVSLDPVTDAMTLLCHVSPEGGWKTLGPFLNDTNEHLQVAMYDFSAPQLFETLKSVLRRGASMKLVYDGNAAANVGQGTKIDDVSEETILRSLSRIAGSNLDYVKAWKGKSGICHNAYHIKVAVKDKKSFWLSSGNWQTSNQPNVDFDADIYSLPKYNREWNIIVDNNSLATVFNRFIDWDFEKSSEKPEDALMEDLLLPELFVSTESAEDDEMPPYLLFAPKKFVFTRNNPLKVQPVLSPDNYIENALEVIRSAKRTLYFQNQYITIPEEPTAEYTELLEALRDKSTDDRIDCRIIIRKAFSADDKMNLLNNLQAMGFDMSKVRFMAETHTKGIIADGEIVMLGSHNWSNPGVQFNRDASLVIYNREVARYYQDVFLHDWERRTIHERLETEASEIVPSDSESMLLNGNFFRLNWSEYLD